jgi:hypothetical protein
MDSNASVDSAILQLASPDPEKRQHAAGELFARGRELAAPILSSWLENTELLGNFGSASPRITIGIAVPPELFEKIRAANESPRLADVPPDQDAKEFELHFSGGVQLDILTTKAPGGAGAIARYLDKFGAGIQQVEFDVSCVDRATETLRTQFNLAPLYAATRTGADGTRVNFFLAARPDGRKVLVELVEK